MAIRNESKEVKHHRSQCLLQEYWPIHSYPDSGFYSRLHEQNKRKKAYGQVGGKSDRPAYMELESLKCLSWKDLLQKVTLDMMPFCSSLKTGTVRNLLPETEFLTPGPVVFWEKMICTA